LTKSKLWIIAGCNGAGKSSFSRAFVESNIIPFDYDAYFMKFHQNILPTDFQDRMAHNFAFQELENQIEKAISGNMDFSYETNFNSIPLFWPQKFNDIQVILNLKS